MKPSEWLNTLSSHEIYIYDSAAQDYESKTGLKPTWPRHTATETKAAIKARGAGGELTRQDDSAWGYEMAHSTALEFLPEYRCLKSGRMSIFYDAIAALETAGH